MIQMVSQTTERRQCKLLSLAIVFFILLPFANFTFAQQAFDNDVSTYDENPRIEVDVRDALVSLNVRDARVTDVLQEIAQKVGLIVYMHDSSEERITLQVENISLPEALAKVLRDYSFALHYVNPASNLHSIYSEPVSKLWVYADNNSNTTGENTLSDFGPPTRIIRPTNEKEEIEITLEEGSLKLVQPHRSEQISELGVMLLDENKDIRLDSVAMLAEIDDADVLTLLASALGDEVSVVREQAVDALLTVDGADTVHLFEQAINDTDPAVRSLAISALVEIDDNESLRVLSTALGNQDPITREETIYALGDLDSDSATELIELGLKDPHPSVRLAAVETLASTARTESIVALAIVLRDESPLVREEVIYALAELGGDSAFELLKQATTDKDKTIASLASETLDSLSN